MTVYESLVVFIGQPQGTFQENCLYMVACLMGSFVFLTVAGFIRILGGLISPRSKI